MSKPASTIEELADVTLLDIRERLLQIASMPGVVVGRPRVLMQTRDVIDAADAASLEPPFELPPRSEDQAIQPPPERHHADAGIDAELLSCFRLRAKSEGKRLTITIGIDYRG